VRDRRCNRTRASVGNAGGNARPSLTNATLAASRLLHRRSPTAPCSKGLAAASRLIVAAQIGALVPSAGDRGKGGARGRAGGQKRASPPFPQWRPPFRILLGAEREPSHILARIRLPHLATFRDARVAEMRFRVRPVKRTRLPMAKSVLRQESVLAALPTELSHSLFAKARSVSLAADQTLFVVGDEGDGCYRVEEGLLKASIAAPAGGERILAILGPGSVVGELSMIDRGPRSASVTALRDSKLSFVGRRAPPPSCSTGKSWPHFRPPPVDFCRTPAHSSASRLRAALFSRQ